MWNGMEGSGMEWNGGESETTATTAVSIGADRAALSLTVTREFSQYSRFSKNNNR